MNESQPKGPEYIAAFNEDAKAKRLKGLAEKADEMRGVKKPELNIAKNRERHVDDGLEAKLRAADELVARRNADIQRQIKDSQEKA